MEINPVTLLVAIVGVLLLMTLVKTILVGGRDDPYRPRRDAARPLRARSRSRAWTREHEESCDV